jgi:ATP-dependent RNA helicase DHX8/PRP22
LGINDNDLAEFVIHLAEKHPAFELYKKVLQENGGDAFSDSLIANLLRIISHMKLKTAKKQQQQQVHQTIEQIKN